MNVLIVEDEHLAGTHLESLIKQYESHIKILARLESIRDTVAYLKSNSQPDLMFLDIHLADGLSFGIFDQAKVECPVIFTTAYDEYALQAFRANSIDYLLKPINFDKLANAMDRYVNWFQTGSRAQPSQMIDVSMLKGLLAGDSQKKQYKSRYVVKRGEHLVAVPVEDILYFYSEDKATLFKTSEGKRYLIDPTLSEVEAQVDPEEFFRINRGMMVRFEAIKDMVSYSNRRLKLILHHPPESEVLVAREKVTEFKNWLDR